jgi:hypothetical protein
MKTLSLLLSIHILLLVAMPSAKLVAAAVKRNQCCSQSSKKEQHQSNTGNCCDMACNPFMVCCNFHALTSQKTSISTPFTYSTQKYRVLSEVVYSHFLSDTWKPPRIV